jgi:uncharacterized protein (DUF433 family)
LAILKASAAKTARDENHVDADDADTLRAYPGLIPADLEAAWEYAAANLAEIDRTIRENEEGEAGFVE